MINIAAFFKLKFYSFLLCGYHMLLFMCDKISKDSKWESVGQIFEVLLSEEKFGVVDSSFHGNMSRVYEPQLQNWDCGVACIKMALKHHAMLKVYSHELEVTQLNSPLWTVDIFSELQKQLSKRADYFNIEFYTTHAGPQTDHHGQFEWYCAVDDRERVRNVFRNCQLNGWKISEERLSMDAIFARISNQASAIMLVDDHLLNSPQKKQRHRERDLNNELDHSLTKYDEKFTGHYIYVFSCRRRRFSFLHMGYTDYSYSQVDRPEDMLFYYLDSARDAGVQSINGHHLDLARRHPGTDDDIIFISSLRNGDDDM